MVYRSDKASVRVDAASGTSHQYLAEVRINQNAAFAARTVRTSRGDTSDTHSTYNTIYIK